MSITLISAIYKHGPTDATQRAVLQALAFSVDDKKAMSDPTCFPSLNALVKRTSLSKATIGRAIKGLASGGWISYEGQTRPNGSITTNSYRLNLDMILGNDEPVSDPDPIVTMTPPIVTMSIGTSHDDNTLLSPRAYPIVTVTTPDQESYQESYQGGEIAHEATPQLPPKKSPPPPVVKYQSIDRTPGGNGYHPPPEPEPAKREPSPEGLAVGDMANAISEVTGMSAKLLKQEVGGFAMELLAAGYTAAQLRTHYTRQRVAGAWNWYDEDWRGKKGERPHIKGIRETIAGATYQAATPKKVSQIDRALAMFNSPKPATG